MDCTQKRLYLLKFFCFVVISALGPHSIFATESTVIIAAGVPKSLTEGNSFDHIFQNLADARISGFFPTFQYQELPIAKSLGHELKFMSVKHADKQAITALKKHKLKLVLPAELFYPDYQKLPALKQDLFAEFISFLSREHLLAVTNYDEPTLHGLPTEATKAIYNRVKQIDPSIPVIMIHPPLLNNDDMTQDQREQQLRAIIAHSQYADIIGFDLYPIPKHIAKLSAPGLKGENISHDTIFGVYLQWLKTNVPDKQYAAVLQGFSYIDQFEEEYRNQHFDQKLLKSIRPPNKIELEAMLTDASTHGAKYIIWWGQAHIKQKDSALWHDILKVSRDAAEKKP